MTSDPAMEIMFYQLLQIVGMTTVIILAVLAWRHVDKLPPYD